MRVMLIKTTGEIAVVDREVTGTFFDLARPLIGAALIEIVVLPGTNGAELLCDEEALLIADPPINPVATALATRAHGRPSPIFGDVLVARHDDEKDVYTDLDIDTIVDALFLDA